MEKQDVITIRDSLTGKNPKIPLHVICDNMIHYYHPDYIMHWDDTKGILTGLKLTDDCTYDDFSRYTIISTSYENIQFIKAFHNEQSARAAIVRSGFSKSELEEADKFFQSINRVNATGSYL